MPRCARTGSANKVKGIDELLMRSTKPGLDNSQKHMVYQTAISAFAKVITVYWPEIDNVSEAKS